MDTLTVCANHINDYAIEEFINNNQEYNSCSYCDRSNVPSISFDTFIDFFEDAVNRHYENVDGQIPWDDEEKKWFGNNVYDNYDLLRDEIRLDCDEILLQDIQDNLSNSEWCHKNPYSPQEHEILMDSWSYFSDLVKHEMRFFFLKAEKKLIRNGLDVYPSEILDKIGSAIKELDMVISTEKKESELFGKFSFFRARVHDKNSSPKSAKDLGSPPRHVAKANRFSPSGISMFYAAQDYKTSIKEVLDYSSNNDKITYCEFISTKALNLIDLSNISEVSIFDINKSELYDASIFLQKFSYSISKPILYHQQEGLEYIPTQVVTEYFRYVLSKEYNKPIDGIIYNSSKNPGSICYVIFCSNEMCSDSIDDESSLLILKKGSLETISFEDANKKFPKDFFHL